MKKTTRDSVRAKRVAEMKAELTYFRKHWKGMTDIEFNLWVYRIVILYGCYYLKNTAIDIVGILNNDDITKEEKYRRINDCFSREAKFLTKFKVSL